MNNIEVLSMMELVISEIRSSPVSLSCRHDQRTALCLDRKTAFTVYLGYQTFIVCEESNVLSRLSRKRPWSREIRMNVERTQKRRTWLSGIAITYTPTALRIWIAKRG